MGDTKRYGDLALLGRLFREARAYWPHLLLLFFVSLLGAPLAILLPLPIKVVVDHVLGDQPFPELLASVLPASLQNDPSSLLVFCAVSVVVIAVLLQLQTMASWLLETWIGQRLILEFRARLFDHLQRLSLGFHSSRGTSDAVYRLQFDATSIQSIAVEGAIPFATAIIKVLILVYATARLDLVLALVALLGGPLLFGITELFRRRLRRRWAEVKELESSAMSVVQESLSSVRVVKAFGQEKREIGRYRVQAERGLRAAMRAVFSHSTFDLIVGITNGVAAAVILYLGARHVQEGTLTLGELVLVLAYLSQLFHPLREVGTRVAGIQKALASAARVFRLFDEPREVEERTRAKSLDRAKGTFAFEDVSFGYDERTPVFEEVSLEIPAAARVGIAGRTGSGKSTLLALLPRFYDPTAGCIRLDGDDLRDLKLNDLRRQFALVLQESVLFSTTIGENIAYGRPDATRAEIQAAARAAAAHEFVSALPDRYETEVGERGSRLSGGERQRVALARAFLCDAPILILDEPTSALDTGTEAEVMQAVERLMENRTVFIIAHRLHTLADCDIRLQVGDGRVVVRDDVEILARDVDLESDADFPDA